MILKVVPNDSTISRELVTVDLVKTKIVIGKKGSDFYKLAYVLNPKHNYTYYWIGFRNTITRWSDDAMSLEYALDQLDDITIMDTMDEMCDLLRNHK